MNTNATQQWRIKYFSSTMQQVLRKSTVCEKICQHDTSDLYYIYNPYAGQETATIATIAGTYSISAWTNTNDSLTVSYQVICANHVFEFEQTCSNYDIMASRMDELAYAVAYGVDYYVLNALCEAATDTPYNTPAGGFTTPANIPVIFSELIGLVAGYADVYKGLYVVVENTDVTGIIQAGAASGFSFADAVLNNGLIGNFMGVDIYVVRSGTFVTDTVGASVTNSGHRVFGVKGVSTYATPGGAHYEEKSVSGKTGKECVAWMNVGFALWLQKVALTIDITLA